MKKLIVLVLSLVLISQYANADELTLSATKDTFLRSGAFNTNEGANTRLAVQKFGKRRALIAFDLETMGQTIGLSKTVTSAKLRLYVVKNGNNWGKLGRNITIHEVFADWTEGNGANATFKHEDEDNDEGDTSKNRGSGSGATWRCATDTDISNRKTNCTFRWKGGTFGNLALDKVNITNSTTGYVEFDVTESVKYFLAGVPGERTQYGWLIKRQNPAKAGSIHFSSREDTVYPPQLVVTY